MEPRFSRGEYWLLETVVQDGRQFLYLPEPGVGRALNKPGHGLDRRALVDTFQRLFQTGLIGAATLRSGGCCGPFERSLSRPEIETALEETRDDQEALGPAYDETYFGLTAAGGRQWEAFAAPDWGRYIQRYERRSRFGRWTIGVLVSPDPTQVDHLLEGARFMGHAVDQNHVHRRSIRPWQATYWKQLPHGYLASYRFDEVESNWEDAPYRFMRLCENRRWCRWI
jgi:hypothetical protein